MLAVGAPYNDGNGSNSGHVRVYAWDETQNKYVQRGADIIGEAASDYSGQAVSMSSGGSVLAIGAHYNDGNGSDSGHVRVFSWNGTLPATMASTSSPSTPSSTSPSTSPTSNSSSLPTVSDV